MESDDTDGAVAEPTPAPRGRRGASDALNEIRERLGRPPGDPLGNSVWANKAAAELAWLGLGFALDPKVVAQMKMVGTFLDRVSGTQTKATIASEIRGLQERAGLRGRKSTTTRLVPVDGSGALRATGRIQR